MKCPICEETFDEDDVRELEIHVDHHLATSLICPVCNLSFGMSNREAFERHVQVLQLIYYRKKIQNVNFQIQNNHFRNILTTRKIHEEISLQIAEIGHSWILSEKRKKENLSPNTNYYILL